MNPDAPLLDRATIEAFRQDPRLRRELSASLETMLRFFGLKFEPDPPRVRELPDFTERAAVWLGSHNLLRITRILLCLRALGLETEARAFFQFLEDLYPREKARIGSSFHYWRRAMAAEATD